MSAVLSAVFVYLFVLAALRLAGPRVLARASSFDVLVLLLIGEATEQALGGAESALMRFMIVVGVFLALSVSLDAVKLRSKRFTRVAEGAPLVVMANGRPLRERLRRSMLDESDILEAGRAQLGLARLDQIDHAVLEIDGSITIVPRASR